MPGKKTTCSIRFHRFPLQAWGVFRWMSFPLDSFATLRSSGQMPVQFDQITPVIPISPLEFEKHLPPPARNYPGWGSEQDEQMVVTVCIFPRG